MNYFTKRKLVSKPPNTQCEDKSYFTKKDKQRKFVSIEFKWLVSV